MQRSLLHMNTLCYCIVVLLLVDERGPLLLSAYAGELPPAPRGEADLNQVYKLYLELVINGYSIQKVVPVVVKGDQYFILRSQLDDLNIKLPSSAQTDFSNTEATAAMQQALTQQEILMLGFSHAQSDWLNLNAMPELSYNYISVRQVIQLQLPPEWMPTQMLGKDSLFAAEIAQSGVGFLNNYDFYLSRPYVGDSVANLFTEQRLFSPFGVLQNTGIYSHQEKNNNLTASQQKIKNGYRRYDTSWQYDHQDSATTVIVGDMISAMKNSWGSALHMGGIQIKRNFATRPDLITYPLPQFAGQAALPSTVDLLINGQLSQQTKVQSGPFIINNLPFVTGRGEAVIVTTDSVGRQVSTTVPFYVSNTILKPGLIDYAFSSGVIREDFGTKDFSYGKFVTSADLRYGLYDWLTLESRAELSSQVQLLGVGGVVKLLNLGVFNASYIDTWSKATSTDGQVPNLRAGQQGAQYSLGYSYNQSRFGLSAQHSKRDRAYADLSSLMSKNNMISSNSHSTTTANTYFSTSRTGSYGLGYIETQANNLKNKLLNFSWTPVLPDALKFTSMSFSFSQDLVKDGWSAALQLSFPLFKNSSTVSAGTSREFGANSSYVNFNRSIPSDGGFGLDLTQKFRASQDTQHQVRISYRNPYFNSEGGASGENSDLNYWFGLRGSLVFMDQEVFASNRLGESFALIDTKAADVPVLYENSPIGRSNRKGHIFVPSVSPYYAANYSIDPLGLSSSYSTNFVEQRMAARRGSGIKISFPIQHNIAANVYLVDQDQQPLAVGAMVHRDHSESSYVGMDGIAYLTQLEHSNSIIVQLDENKACTATFAVDLEQAKKQIVNIEHVLCREMSQ